MIILLLFVKDVLKSNRVGVYIVLDRIRRGRKNGKKQ